MLVKSTDNGGVRLPLQSIYILTLAAMTAPPLTLNNTIITVIKPYMQSMKNAVPPFLQLKSFPDSIWETHCAPLPHLSPFPHPSTHGNSTSSRALSRCCPEPGSLTACAHFLPEIKIFVQLSVSANGLTVSWAVGQLEFRWSGPEWWVDLSAVIWSWFVVTSRVGEAGRGFILHKTVAPWHAAPPLWTLIAFISPVWTSDCTSWAETRRMKHFWHFSNVWLIRNGCSCVEDSLTGGEKGRGDATQLYNTFGVEHTVLQMICKWFIQLYGFIGGSRQYNFMKILVYGSAMLWGHKSTYSVSFLVIRCNKTLSATDN